MKILPSLTLAFLLSSWSLYLFGQTAIIEKRFVPGAQTASILGNWALWHNPAGLGFMGGQEISTAYLYEWSELGNRHHGGANIAVNLMRALSLAAGFNTQAAFTDKAKANLGNDVNGIVGGGLKLGQNLSVGLSFLKSYHFLAKRVSPTLMTIGLQVRPWPYLALGAHYQEVRGEFYSAPNITAGLSIRPYKEMFTIGFDNRWAAKGAEWKDGFHVQPIFSLKSSIGGYGAAVSAEIPDINNGWNQPIFSLSLDINWAHLGLSLSGLINPSGKNYGLGAIIRTSSEEWPSVKKPVGQWVNLTIDRDGTIEKPRITLAQRLFLAKESPLSVLALLRRIESDESVDGVILNLNGFSFGDAKTQEWRNAILALKQARKEVVVYLDAPSERDYYIASAADRILMNKEATLSLRHFQATLVYFADLLEKVGVKADAVVAGSYKTAPRQWTNRRPQKEELEVAYNILNNFYETMLDDVVKTRNIDKQKLKILFDQGELNADEAKAAGLVDELVPPHHTKIDNEKKLKPIWHGYENRTFKREAWDQPKRISVIPINNAIVDGRVFPSLWSSFFPITGAKDVVDEIEIAQNDPDVVGIIVRIDSPGGDAIAGHKINQALTNAQKIKPVVTSMSDVAASAGYLIATGSEHILAMPNTITGSIGVFSLMFSGEQLAQKIGVFSKELSPIKNPGPTMLRTITEEERKQSQKIVDWYYRNFIDQVSLGLKLDKETVLKNADGRVWLGSEALDRKLIHGIGGFADAVDTVKLLANIPKDEEVIIDVKMLGQNEQFSLGASLTALFNNQGNDADIKQLAPIAEPYVKALEAYRLNDKPQARLPFDIDWHRSSPTR